MSISTFFATRRRLRAAAFGMAAMATALMSTVVRANADGFPSRPIQLIVLFPPGNGIDTSARSFAEVLAKELDQQVLVVNRPGGNGIVAVQALKSAPPDGYTILVSSSSPTTIATAFGKTLPYDPFNDFKPVAGFIRSVGLFTVSADSKLTSMREWAGAVQAKGEPFMVGTYADGYYLTSQQLARQAGVQLQNVPYKGHAAILQDLVGGRLDMAYGDTQSPQELINSGKVRALAVTGTSRHAAYPDVPTVTESGFPDFSYYNWNVFFVRSETPAALVEKLGEAIRRALNSPDFQTFTRERGSEPMLDDVPAIQQMMAEEVELYKSLIADTAETER